ncbi:MAG TPA: sigma-54 dependent transcriptional regulator [Casimicrobiaceae bacterium]|nr:sigma-54 dependent transcriptional regulator [Casimicrobiaceae bacterium]
MTTNRAAQVCLVEDDDIMGESLVDRFTLEGFTCDWHKTARSAAGDLKEKRYDVVVSDIRLPDRDGDNLFEELQAEQLYLPPWIFITGYGTIERAIALMKLGAADYVTKPFDLDELMVKLRAYVPASPHDERLPTLGLSPGMRRIEDMLPRLANQSTTVLITGQSGVGKEVVAREIHRLDQLRGIKPFVAVNCGGIPENLLEAELFGHERGAFTGAMRLKHGFLEQANGGTLFLDEIGDMPLAMQVKLLRVLQERTVTRLGSEQSVAVDFRLICATHRDLKKLVDQGTFREDLFYRVNVVHLRVPPLRERPEDILWYARRFLREVAQQGRGPQKLLSPGAEKAMLNHLWPGNVRELRHCIERAYVLTPGNTLDPNVLFDEEQACGDCGVGVNCVGVARPTLSNCLEECERQYLLQELTRNDWQMTKTAAAIGISRKNLWERLRRLGLTVPAQALREAAQRDSQA